MPPLAVLGLLVLVVGLGSRRRGEDVPQSKSLHELITGPFERFAPHSPAAVQLFEQAARLAGVPVEWARSRGLHEILARESDGIVGVPNYKYGADARDATKWPAIWDELRRGYRRPQPYPKTSSATGLGQLLLANVDRFYPLGRRGVGVAVQEAAGMLRYIASRYGDPDTAWAQYGTKGEGY